MSALPWTARSAITALVLAVAATAGADEPHGKNCQGEGRAKLLVSELLVVQSAPTGVENQLQLGGCTPLIREPGDLFDYSNAQAGLLLYLSPVYALPGAYVSVAPLSILELRAEAQAVQTWTIGQDGAGWFPADRPDAPIDVLPASEARPASGWTATFTGTLQAEVPLGGAWTVAAVNSLAWGYWELGDAPYGYNPRYMLVMAQRDWVGRNTALLLVGRTLREGVKLQAGVTDEYTWVQRAGNRQNIVAGLVAATISRWPGPGQDVQPFLRVGAYTDHPFRKGELQLLGGVGVTFDVTPGRFSMAPQAPAAQATP